MRIEEEKVSNPIWICDPCHFESRNEETAQRHIREHEKRDKFSLGQEIQWGESFDYDDGGNWTHWENGVVIDLDKDPLKILVELSNGERRLSSPFDIRPKEKRE